MTRIGPVDATAPNAASGRAASEGGRVRVRAYGQAGPCHRCGQDTSIDATGGGRNPACPRCRDGW